MCLSKKLQIVATYQHSPTCSPFNSEEHGVLLKFINGIFVTHSLPEGNIVTLIAEIA